MITNILNTALIEAMKEKIPDGINLANTLMDILFLGKEAVYRRLRGEVPFTLGESVIISQKLGVSLDKLVGLSFNGNALFYLDLVQYQDPFKTYSAIIEDYVNVFREMAGAPDSVLCTSSNIIPQTFYLKYENLSKFRLFKWIYQHEKIDNVNHFDGMVMPEEVLKIQKAFVKESQYFNKTFYLWDCMIFQSLINDIRYFDGINLVSKESIQVLKEELLLLVDELEEIASKGKFSTGKDVQIYISNINFEATYSYVETKTTHISLIRVFSINSITSRDSEVFDSLKEWILSLKKYSTLISQSGEMQRRQFFMRQREIINEL